MRIRAARDPLEGSVEVNDGELLALVGLVEHGAGEMVAMVGDDPAPYSIFLSSLKVQRAHNRPVCIAVDWSGERLVITGGLEELRFLAKDLSGVAAASIGSHHHFEYLPGDSYFAEDSMPTVVQLVE